MSVSEASSVFRIALVNMPFATLNLASLALSQLQSVLRNRFGDRVEVDVVYANQDVIQHIGLDFYQYVVESLEANNTGLGDWLFRQSAFPEAEDNAEAYFRRYFPSRSPEATARKAMLLEKRREICDFVEAEIDRHALDQADLVGITTMFQQNTATFALARALKARRPDLPIIAGGANCETPMGEEIALNVDAIDFVFSGPALVSLPSFVQHLLDGDDAACHGMRGVFTKRNLSEEGVGVRGTIGAELPINVPVELDYDAFLDTLEQTFPEQQIPPRLSFETSRGCWWGQRSHCTFCGLNGSTMAYRSMQPHLALDTLHTMFERYGDRCTRFEAIDNILPKNYVAEVFPKLKTPAGVTLFYEIKADMPESDIRVMAAAGVTEVQPGIESLATSTLKLMRKGTTAFTNLMLLKHCRVHGIFPLWNLLIGFPGEGEDVYAKYMEDLPTFIHLSPPDGVNPVRFDRFSPYFNEAERFGLDLHPYDYYGFIYPFGEESLANLAYYFMDHNIGADYFLHMARWIDRLATVVEDWRGRWGARGVAPTLSFSRDDALLVEDTRSGEDVRHRLTCSERQLLDAMNTPQHLPTLARLDLDDPTVNVEATVRRLRDLGLVFFERKRHLSLVLPPLDRENRGRTLIYGLEGA